MSITATRRPRIPRVNESRSTLRRLPVTARPSGCSSGQSRLGNVSLQSGQRGVEIVRVQKDIERYCERPGDRGEQFEAAWDRMMSKRCEAARAQLKTAEADRHSPRQTTEDARAEVKRYCNGED